MDANCNAHWRRSRRWLWSCEVHRADDGAQHRDRVPLVIAIEEARASAPEHGGEFKHARTIRSHLSDLRNGRRNGKQPDEPRRRVVLLRGLLEWRRLYVRSA